MHLLSLYDMYLTEPIVSRCLKVVAVVRNANAIVTTGVLVRVRVLVLFVVFHNRAKVRPLFNILSFIFSSGRSLASKELF